MDEQNGEVFDHHAELFSQIGAVSDHETFKDFVLDSSGLLDNTSGSKPNQLAIPGPGSTSQGSMWSHSFNEPTPLLINHNRAMYNNPVPVPPLDDVDNASALLDSLVKNLPAPDGVMDQFSSQHFLEKSQNVRHFNHAPGQLFEGLHRISTDKVTQSVLDNMSRFEGNTIAGKCNDFDSLSWNGVVADPVHTLNFHSQNRSIINPQSSLDKNGNSAVFNHTHIDKLHCGFPQNLAEQMPQNNSLIRLSPSASVESNIHTPTTSYESASPLSSNRTPIRSDESISPMGSGHTPLRMDDSTSPLASVKTPMRMDEGSPMGRTPHRMEEGCSPAGISGILSSKIDGSPSHKLNGQTPQRFENYSSPPSVLRRNEGKSPASYILPSPKTENSNKITDPLEDNDGSVMEPKVESFEDDVGMYPCERRKKPKETEARDEKSPAMIPVETLIKSQGMKKIPIPFVSAKRIDDPVITKKAAKRTLPRKSDSELYLASSSLSKKSESESKSLVTNQFGGIKTENEVPDSNEDNLSDNAQTLEDAEIINAVEDNLTKCRKRRKKADISVPNAKRRFRKKVTIYQSSVSPEETGIKLKIKLAPSFQQSKPLKKRRSKRQYLSDEEEGGSAGKKSKKVVRFSSGTKEPESSEQTMWGSKIPPDVLQRVFKFVIEEQGCVPSLVRYELILSFKND